jgi:uncharacterized repeat protein (TIGR01451 family)
MSHTTPRRGGVRRYGALTAVLMVSGVGLLAGQAAYAAAPPAGTSISNQATASYKDSNGAIQPVSSNTVVTQVTQVGAYTLVAGTSTGNTKPGAAGATVYMPYTLTNTGNGSDTFSIRANEVAGGADFTKIELYLDKGDGTPFSTTPLCTVSTAGSNCDYSVAVASGSSYKFLVAYTIPSTATAANWAASNTGTVKVAPLATSTFLSTYSQTAADKSETRTDTVNLTTGVAFNVGKAIVAPAISAVGGLSWPVATSGQQGTKTTYTISYSNSGATAGNLYIKDVLPSGLTYVAGQSVISCAAATALTEAAGGDAALCNSLGIDFVQSGQTIEAVIPNVQPVSNGTLSFQVTVNNTAAMGVISNTASYTAEGCTAGATVSACSSSTLATTNSADFTVMATRKVTFNVLDSTAGTPKDATDAVTSAFIVPGSFVKQTHVITNNGNADDRFNLTASAAGVATGLQSGKSAFTAYTPTWLAADGVTLLSDTNSDGIPDTGVLAAGASKTVVLQIFVPATTTVASPANLEALLTATSTNDPTIKDASYADVTNVIGGYVDLLNSATGTATSTATVGADVGPGPGQLPTVTTTAIQAGSAVHQISLFVKNYDSVANTYNLFASSNSSFPGTLPAGWSVTFSSTSCTSVAPIADTGSVAAGATVQVYACVSSPVTSPTTTQPVYFKVATANNTSAGSSASDIVYDAIQVVAANAYSFSLTANGKGTMSKGNNNEYAHTLVNTGEQMCGAGAVGNYLKVTATLPADKVTAGWTTAIYNGSKQLISDGKLTTPATAVNTGGLAAGASVNFIVRVYAPGGANVGDTSDVTVTVTDVDSTGATTQIAPNGCGTQSNVDTSTVVAGSVVVKKTQNKTTGTCVGQTTYPVLTSDAAQSAAPGDCLYYQVVVTNNGSAPVTNVSVTDNAPAYTTLSTAPAPTCASTGLTGTAAALSNPTSTSVSCGSTANELAPGGTLTLQFAVELNK